MYWTIGLFISFWFGTLIASKLTAMIIYSKGASFHRNYIVEEGVYIKNTTSTQQKLYDYELEEKFHDIIDGL